MNYDEAVNYVTNETNRGIVLGLDVVNKIACELNLTKPTFKTIHITGTNGKGSTGAFISSILTEAGYKVGHFSSPAILDRLDTIKINGIQISKNDYAGCVSIVKETSESVGVLPTSFEVETIVAYLYFSKQKCDYAVIEVGMGGRLDATNFVQNTFMCVFTPIAIDHTKFLGANLSDIAREKQGIIKPGAKIVSSKENIGLIDGADFTDEPCRYELGMLGVNQRDNATLAVLACKQIGGVSEENIINGLKRTHLPARFDFVQHNGRQYVIDGAHNPHAGRALAQNLRTYLKGKKINAIIGMFKDKDIENTIKPILPLVNEIYFIKAPTERGLDAKLLREKVIGLGFDCKRAFDCVTMQNALDKSIDCDVTVIFGSLSLAREFYG